MLAQLVSASDFGSENGRSIRSHPASDFFEGGVVFFLDTTPLFVIWSSEEKQE